MPAKQLVRTIYDSINAGQLGRIDPLVADDVIGPDGAEGRAAFVANLASVRAGFPDIRFTIEDLLADEDRVAVRWSWVATHTGTFRGIAPTGKRITNSGIAIYQIRDGRVVRSWLETDRLGALQQLGVVPMQPAPAKE